MARLPVRRVHFDMKAVSGGHGMIVGMERLYQDLSEEVLSGNGVPARQLSEDAFVLLFKRLDAMA